MDLFFNLLILIGLGLVLKQSTLLFINRAVKSSKKAFYFQIAFGIAVIILGNILLRSPLMTI